MKINIRLTLAFLLIFLASLTVISILAYPIAKKSLTQQVLNQLESVASIQESRIESIVDQNLERLVLVSSRTQLRFSLESFIRDPSSEYQNKMNRILNDARSSINSFIDISVLTLDGKIVASTDVTKIGTRHSNEEFFVRGKTQNCADIFFLDEDRNLRVYLSGPLYLENKLLGVVVIESDVDNIISLVSDYSGLGETGETLLAKRDGNGDALFLSPLRFDPHAALSRTVPKKDMHAPITQALLKSEQLFTDVIDYRGQPVLASTRYIEKTDWGLVVKIDREEAFAPTVQLRNLLVLIILVSSVVIIIIAHCLARSITNPIIKLTQVASKISEGDLTRRAEVTSTDEASILAQAFNQMTDNLISTNTALDRKIEELQLEITERKRAEEQIQHLQNVLKAIRNINQLIVHEKNQQKLLQGACEILSQTRDYKLVWIGLVEEGTKNVLPVAQAGFEESYLKSVKMTWDDSEAGRGPTGTAIKTKKPFVMRDIAGDPRYKLWREEAIKRGYASSAAVPIVYENRVFGALNVYAALSDAFDEEEIGLLVEVGQDIAFALHNIELEEERKRIEESLRKAHDELEVKVAERTRELAQANTQLKELDQLKSMFIASMSHELRTPLNSIIGFTGMILQGMAGEITAEQRKQLTMVKNSAKHLLALINDIIDLSKIEAGTVELAIEEFDLSGLVQEVKDSFKVAVAEKGIKISLKMPKRLIIESDERRTKQVLMNLVGNAIKFTDRGEIGIKVAKKDGMAEISVRDAGIGIREEDMDRLFKAFSQIHVEGRPRQEGTGLGLYLSKKIADLLGGEIWAESEFGKGSKFIFALPLKYEEVNT